VRADAEDFLASIPEGASFERIFILFPDPWPKRRHHKNRVVNATFLSEVARGARKGAGLYFRTDHEPYFRKWRQCFARTRTGLMPAGARVAV
jgi:tRNA (guanine-N7-)-methyltransferase